ncbi:MAG: hypothetical protein A2W91_00295 [Bacteroidetes bacterium GWF2_38_335]|nr:MAG: hypothetical protein A2W91_00295 [Bacteroidetes bacterium GWF2_38_335]OFY78273.1 MAG: hypothetical protein A2281_03675 [Bacteroidetes bacterium RIFOXYA12_FULL_38_20]HBS87533.1 hypothetical protein [Bacteroidales bacterium]
MDLQTRKLNAIQYLINIQDENLFNKIEETILKSSKKGKRVLKPFTQKQLIERAEKSNKDYVAGKVKTQEQLEIESENW